ncbi:hypothetical protein [Massilia soli]|uniref:Uncharacterized protein n=1 Tax=Massilia soli TaxID=2792854 RepID=A0ABS7SVX2_9BURK|nr:hypothetical protein [Massilia soli]MBZ2210111.1 hypothetical protein [Massilia soli]
MATWQFVVSLIPSRWCGIAGNGTAQLVDRDGYGDLSSAWQQYQPDAMIVSLISKILPPSASWHEDLKIWGDETGSDIHVSYAGTQVESVIARIDTRTDTARMCASVVELARTLDCCLYLGAARLIIPSDVTELGKAIATSTAAQFSAARR